MNTIPMMQLANSISTMLQQQQAQHVTPSFNPHAITFLPPGTQTGMQTAMLPLNPNMQNSFTGNYNCNADPLAHMFSQGRQFR